MVQRRREQGKPIGRPRKPGADELDQVFEWRRRGPSYSAIATLVEEAYAVDVDRSTVYRYCREEEVEKAEN